MTNNVSIIGQSCVGCGNCNISCHKGAIDFNSDLEGFLYPEVNSKCIECGQCLKKCPQVSMFDNKSFDQISYIAISKDKDILENAASGGIFGTIAKSFLTQQGSFVCGAAFCDNVVKHIIIKDCSKIHILQNSKYVQSELGNVFIEIKDILSDLGRRVLFSGTPCQVAALNTFLGRKYPNLFTIDIICHGVPSPKFLSKDLSHYSPQIDKVTFRWRNRAKKSLRSYFFLSLLIKGKERIYSSSYDPYFAMFMRGETFRYSCYECKYANLQRQGDITIGDCDTAHKYKDFYLGQSKSTVIINSDQGWALWISCDNSFNYCDLDIVEEAQVNHQLLHPSSMPNNRNSVYQDIRTLSYTDLQKKYAPVLSKGQKIRYLLQSVVPDLYKFIIRKHLQ